MKIKEIYRSCKKFLFIVSGKKPWSYGYGEYRDKRISETIANIRGWSEKLGHGYGLRLDERIVEYPWVLSCLPKGPGRLLDAGSILNFDFILAHPSLNNKEIFVSTLAPESQCYWRRGISYIYEDLRDSCFKDEYFDWVVSLSTIEHIGFDNAFLYTKDTTKRENRPDDHLQVIREFRRMLKKGGTLYLSVPFGRRKNHGWFQVFDGPMIDSVIEAFSPGSMREYHYRYEPEGWSISSREESRDATYFDIHRQKRYDADYAAASRAIVCLELTK